VPTEIEQERARQADRLANHEPVLVEALTNMRMSALNELATVPETDLVRFRQLQAKVACTEEFLAELAGFILAGQTVEPPG
jgi:hypothetical protein